MLRFIAQFAALVSFSTMAHGACQGQDLRPRMTPAQQSELADLLEGRPYATGNHWIAEKDGEVLHLIGTVHLDDLRLDAPTARLTPVIENAAMLLLELTETDKKNLQTSMTTDPDILLLTGPTLPDLLSEADWQMLSEAVKARGVPPFMAAKFQPWYLSMLLGIPPCMMAELTEENGLDARLERIAMAQGIPTRALEGFDTAIRIFADTPIETQITMLKASIMSPEGSEDLFETLIAAYAEENHAESWLATTVLAPDDPTLTEAEEQAFLAKFEAALLYDRNRAWIPVIEQALADTDGPVVAAFGAGHLSGELGVLRLLEEAGYQLRQQPF